MAKKTGLAVLYAGLVPGGSLLTIIKKEEKHE
jgi:hypothetical protein